MAAPHGGIIVPRFVPRDEENEVRKRARSFPHLTLTPQQLSDAYLIAEGAFSPLKGFMTSRDYMAVLEDMRLADGLPWPLPVTLAVPEGVARSLRQEQAVALGNQRGDMVGVLEVGEVYHYDRHLEASLVHGTAEPLHPGVGRLFEQGEFLIGGTVQMFHRRSGSNGARSTYLSTPAETRYIIRQKGWQTIVGAQPRRPMHRADEYIHKCALEMMDGLLIHLLTGESEKGNVPVDTKMRYCEVLLSERYPSDRMALAGLPTYIRYAGAREAVFHALVRKNYGCTHFIVAERQSFGFAEGASCDVSDLRDAFDEFTPDELGIAPLFFEEPFFCGRCQSAVTSRTCPHPGQYRVRLEEAPQEANDIYEQEVLSTYQSPFLN